jgi:iron complex transport system substrate-binding protein
MLGLGESIVGVTHECDFPEEAREKTQVVSARIPHNLTSGEIDRIVSESRTMGESTYAVNTERLKEAKPDLIITQALCEVCAVSEEETLRAIRALPYEPRVLSLHPRNIEEILGSILAIGEATGRSEAAREIVNGLTERIERVRRALSGERDKPRVLCIEWLEPPYVAGHWVPEMVEIAGGEHGIVRAGEPSRRVGWEEIREFAPQVVLVMPCGFDIDRTLLEIDALTRAPEWNSLPAVRKGHVYLLDANSYFSRPAPRVVDGIEIMAYILHGEAVDDMVPPPGSVINLRNYLHFQNYLG